jgi:hypothetical protein
MTKKDYVAAANLLQRTKASYADKMLVVRVFVAFFEADSPRFNEDLFVEAAMKGAVKQWD